MIPIEASVVSGNSDNLSFSNNAEWVVADIALGAWTPHTIALACLNQLAPLSAQNADSLTDDSVSFGDFVGRLIDMETLGDQQLITAHNFAKAVAELARATATSFLIIGPRSRSLWDRNSVAFLSYLSRSLDRGRIHISVPSRDTMPSELDVLWTNDLQEDSGESGSCPQSVGRSSWNL